MAFTFEDGSGVADANSLASVEFADAYHAERGNVAWAALELATKQQNLVKATDYFVGMYGQALYGALVLATQALPFPRIVNYANVGVPIGIKQAIVELALISATTPLMPTIKRGKKRVKVGPIEVEYDGSGPMQDIFVAASLRLAPFLRNISGAMVRLVRS